MAPLPQLLLVRRARGALAIEHLEDRSLLSGGFGVSTGNFLPADETASVRAADISAFVGGSLLQADRRLEDGAWQSEVIVVHQGRTLEIEVAPDGTIAETATSIAPIELPERVAASLASRFSGATIQKVEAVIEAGVLGYDVVLDWGQEWALEVEIGLDGQIAAVERTDDGTATPAMQTLAADSRGAHAPASAISGRQADAAPNSAEALRSTSFAPAEQAATAPVVVALGGAVDAAPAAAARPLPEGVETQPASRGAAPSQAAQSAGTALVQAPVDASRDGTNLEVAVRFAAVVAGTFALPSLTPRLAGLLTDAVQLQVLDVRALDQALSEFLNEVEALTNALAVNTRSETASRIMLAAVVLAGLELVRREAKKSDKAHRPGPTRHRNECGTRDGALIP